MGRGQLPAASLHVLLALLDGDKHGYAIMQEIEELSDGAVRMGAGTLYGTIKRLLSKGLIEEVTHVHADADDERRRYYRLTAAGESAAAEEMTRLHTLLQRAQRLRPGFGTAG